MAKLLPFSPKLGAWPVKTGTRFTVWAPKCKWIEVMVKGKYPARFPLREERNGYFSEIALGVRPGAVYKFCLNGKDEFPDPCSFYQPEGPHGPSVVVDHTAFRWDDSAWQKKGISLKGQVIYELHIGTFTPEGTYLSAIKKLPQLKKIGITLLEIMPLAEFPGRWNWGYDGVCLYAPSHVYGTPDDLKKLINEAHKIGIAVILDVVYNHLGPDGNYLKCYSDHYFTDKHKTDWGEAINYDGTNAKESREFFIQNACYWLKEFHFDGLRLDATQNIYDNSKIHVLAEVTKRGRETVQPKRILFIGENESQDVKLMTPLEKGGYGLDALWNDDFHHSMKVALTGKREAYYTDYLGTPQELISSTKNGFLYQGQFYSWQKHVRGTFVHDVEAPNFVHFLQNHDQVANSLYGKRASEESELDIYRALTALCLLSPQTPMFFMGQEFGASTPFTFFADHHDELAPLVFKGRKEFLSQFPSFTVAMDKVIDPKSEKAFKMSKLNWDEWTSHKEMVNLHTDLLKIRREDEVFSRQDWKRIEGAVLNELSCVIRFRGDKTLRLLILNLGNDFTYSPCPEPLLAHLPKKPWQLIWGSEDTKYGGQGIVNAYTAKGWRIQVRSVQIFSS
jgi:maltooligosyltrehalose trehalohydrolase